MPSTTTTAGPQTTPPPYTETFYCPVCCGTTTTTTPAPSCTGECQYTCDTSTPLTPFWRLDSSNCTEGEGPLCLCIHPFDDLGYPCTLGNSGETFITNCTNIDCQEGASLRYGMFVVNGCYYCDMMPLCYPDEAIAGSEPFGNVVSFHTSFCDCENAKSVLNSGQFDTFSGMPCSDSSCP